MIKCQEENGIVTRKDVSSMCIYSGSKVLFEELRDNLKRSSRSDKIVLNEIGLPRYSDYSSVIFNEKNILIRK